THLEDLTFISWEKFTGGTNRSTRIVNCSWIIPRVPVKIQPIDESRRICRRPPPELRRVIPRAMVVEAAFFVAFLAGVAVALGGDFGATARRMERRAPIGMVLLEGDDLAFGVGLDQGGAEVVTELIAKAELSYGAWLGAGGVDGLGFDHGDAAAVVRQVQGFALELKRGALRVGAFAEDLEAA